MQSQLSAEQACIVCGRVCFDALATDRIARFIREYLPKHYEVDEDPVYDLDVTLERLVEFAIRCSDTQLAKHIAEHLVDAAVPEDGFYAPGQLYRRIPSPFDSAEHERWYCFGEWVGIREELKHGRRFFNEKAKVFFEKLIDEALKARSQERQDVPAAVRNVPAYESFYRARIASKTGEVERFLADPAAELGAPPKQFAANNRMSAAGVPLLYVSSDALTCMAEVRPQPSDTLVVGRFESTAPMKLFDFTALGSGVVFDRLSLFDARYDERQNHRVLLEYLHDEISQPVETPDTEYVVTQALAELICYHPRYDFDGLIFRSAQRPEGENYVLFDRGPEHERQSPGWRPSFKVGITPGGTTVCYAGAAAGKGSNIEP
jgi:hypothetical protein